jgi:DNA polymerase elongation subunit (family B)
MTSIPYYVVDIETCPVDLDKHHALDKQEQKKLINPIDSKIVAIGLRTDGQDYIMQSDDEKQMLEEFWRLWKEKKKPGNKIIGFNIKYFDIPFLVTRSLIHGVTIVPFNLKEIVDIREKISAYRSGHTRGTLKEFATLTGIETTGLDGSHVAQLCEEKDYETLVTYLKNDLEITDKLYQRLRELKILYIERW